MYKGLIGLQITLIYIEEKSIYKITNAPRIRKYIHKNYELPLYNMKVLFKDIFIYLWKTIYQWKFKSTKLAQFNRFYKNNLFLFNKTNKLAVMNLRLNKLLNN